MNWIFLDSIEWDYDVATPMERPLGGSQSALCYLAAALARRGHAVATLTATRNPRVVNGVRCLSNAAIPEDLFEPSDTIVVVLNGPATFGPREIRKAVSRMPPIILWTQHAHDQPAVAALADPACLALWDGIVCISDWQRNTYCERLSVPLERMEILRNAIGPAFEHLFHKATELAAAKPAPLRLIYTSTPFRGLHVLLAAFPEVLRRHPECRLDVFSSMQVYNVPSARDPFRPLYTDAEGVKYRGSIPQPALAAEMKAVHVLAYPNTFAETACIAAMEALAAGALVVSTNLGALPETCAGWARLIPPISPTNSAKAFQLEFQELLCALLADIKADPRRFLLERFDQAQNINATCTWDVRAGEWEAAGSRWLRFAL
jgi:glycosyltransferase involved in cell wall biosynthesis